MSEQELRDDSPPPEPDDERLEMGDPADEWEETEPSPHQGEEGQEPV